MESIYHVGDLGHLMLLLSYVSVGLSFCGAFFCIRSGEERWWRYACWMAALHAVTLLTASGLLLYLLVSDRFEYHYVWSHSMTSLPIAYKIAAFWEGQEGSFLLWMMGHLCCGVVCCWRSSAYRRELLALLALIQMGLASMLLGVVIGGWKLGSSPFLLLREVIEMPIFATNPGFVPEDGMGLSPLLQNYWMVIHPPVLFMGFAMVSVPFAYVAAGLWQRRLRGALEATQLWLLVAIAVLGVGILLGAIWAYETLNFGGYWNWDPVENAVYVPWLVLVAAQHLLRLYLRRGVALTAAVYAVFLAFFLVLYATFLIRSGVLGQSSVHAFTDAGLSAQLIGWIAVMVVVSCVLVYRRRAILRVRRRITYAPHKLDLYLVLGASVLALMALQVLLPTSLPVFNELVYLVGGESNLAPPADPVAFYSSGQLYFVLLLLLLSAVGQLVYGWSPRSRGDWLRLVARPLVMTLIVATLAVIGWKMWQIEWIFLLTAALYALVANGWLMIRLLSRSPISCGGALAHMGVALMVLGVLFSSGYAELISTNHTGLIWHRDFPDEVNEENILLFQHHTRQMEGYSLRYRRKMRRLEGVPFYVSEDELEMVPNRGYCRVKKDLRSDQATYARRGDTVRLEVPVRTYFEVSYMGAEATHFIYPSAERTSDEGIIYSPYILRSVTQDIYAHVRTFSSSEDVEWSEPQTIEVQPRAQFFAHDYAARILSVEQLGAITGLTLNEDDLALRAKVEVIGPDGRHVLEPTLIIRKEGKGTELGFIYDERLDLGLRIALTGIYPDRDRVELQLRTTQVPWVILEVVRKPLINLLWGGALLLVIGLGWTWTHRRAKL